MSYIHTYVSICRNPTTYFCRDQTSIMHVTEKVTDFIIMCEDNEYDTYRTNMETNQCMKVITLHKII